MTQQEIFDAVVGCLSAQGGAARTLVHGSPRGVPVVMRLTPAIVIARRTQDAYSSDRYRSWRAVAAALLKRGYDERQVEAIMRSKWTRWAAADQVMGKASAKDLLAFIDNPRNECSLTAVRELVQQTF